MGGKTVPKRVGGRLLFNTRILACSTHYRLHTARPDGFRECLVILGIAFLIIFILLK